MLSFVFAEKQNTSIFDNTHFDMHRCFFFAKSLFVENIWVGKIMVANLRGIAMPYDYQICNISCIYNDHQLATNRARQIIIAFYLRCVLFPIDFSHGKFLNKKKVNSLSA